MPLGTVPTRVFGDPIAAGSCRLRVGFVLAQHFTLSALSNFIDVLRLAADDGDESQPIRCQWHIMSAGRVPIRSSSDLSIEPTSGLLDPELLDCVIVVGGLLQRGPQLDRRTELYLTKLSKADVDIVGVCTGSFILQRLGLLAGRKCCVSWYHHRDFVEEFGVTTAVTDQIYVVDGRRITCSGGQNIVHVAAFLVERNVGPSFAQKALHILLVDRMRPGSAAQSAPPTEMRSDHDRVSRALLLMEQNLSAPVPIARIAIRVGLSPRQLERIFKDRLSRGPRAAYLRLRLRHARWMLQTTLSLAEIAAETGFVDGSHLSRAYKSAYGVSPSKDRDALEHGTLRSSLTRRVFDQIEDASLASPS